MTITSTEFQQNVGYYLGLAEKGEEVNIEKLKPVKGSFVLKKRNVEVKTKKKLGRIEQIIKEAKKHQFHSGIKGENGLKLQRRVRS